ncbi:MAG: hypothetical protein DRI90_14875 [Deltaproteobacteria bacterium]|nr:MAG: hypothetical protein DRI90_14875 [Deltaproteobacteria bacterium]
MLGAGLHAEEAAAVTPVASTEPISAGATTGRRMSAAATSQPVPNRTRRTAAAAPRSGPMRRGSVELCGCQGAMGDGSRGPLFSSAGAGTPGGTAATVVWMGA